MDSIISPDGRFLWDGKRWVKSPKGTIQKFVWGGEEWEKLPPEKGGAIFSPDGNEMWTGRGWIPSPPGEIDSLNDVTKAQKKTLPTSLLSSFGNHNKEQLDITSKAVSYTHLTLPTTTIV